MKHVRFMLSALCLSCGAHSAVAAPICPQMLTKSTLEKRYQRLAPIYNSDDTGWIFGSDQFDNTYALDEVQKNLMAQIVDRLAAQGTQLAMLIAPPRPVIAGQEVVDATLGKAATKSVVDDAVSFQRMIEHLNAKGAVAPDLLELATSNATIRGSYYFMRDTHWTNTGAAHSAIALAQALDPDVFPAFDVDSLGVLEQFAERGSLSDIARATCGIDPQPETSPVFDYAPHLPTSGNLLGDAAVDAVLVGTSFSDRYKRDQYQVADALSAALGVNVVNLSVSGGGMIGPFESYILTGQFAAQKPPLLIWEFPYTYQLKEPHLRQILGALHANDTTSRVAVFDVVDGAVELPLSPDMHQLGITPIGGEPLKLSTKLRLADGSVVKLPLSRKSRMAEVAKLDTWWVGLSGYDLTGARFELAFKPTATVTRVEFKGLP